MCCGSCWRRSRSRWARNVAVLPSLEGLGSICLCGLPRTYVLALPDAATPALECASQIDLAAEAKALLFFLVEHPDAALKGRSFTLRG